MLSRLSRDEYFGPIWDTVFFHKVWFLVGGGGGGGGEVYCFHTVICLTVSLYVTLLFPKYLD